MAEQDERPLALFCQMHSYSVTMNETVVKGHGNLRMEDGRRGPDSGALAGGNRSDPPHDVRCLQQAVRLEKLADFGQGVMHDRVDDDGAKERGFELLSFLELFGPAASCAGKGEVGACRHVPGCLEYRGNLCHEPRLQRRERIRFGKRPARYILQQAPLRSGAWRAVSRRSLGK